MTNRDDTNIDVSHKWHGCRARFLTPDQSAPGGSPTRVVRHRRALPVHLLIPEAAQARARAQVRALSGDHSTLVDRERSG
ncbi:hypothetical protein GCM10009843_37250 [Nocardioides bigeumensis]|uniref:Uncharacterized protein n=1 Tax=Nocardioides bigeumensis TaxID=433657 RepID=A0ABN2YUE0_9ACTN